MHYISDSPVGGGTPLYQLKITLRWSKPPIWRRLVVRGDMKLSRLHSVIQTAMGWLNCHLHHFIVGRTVYGVPDPEFADMGPETLNEKRYTVADVAPGPKKKFLYEYDFGDGWLHEITVEKVVPPGAAFKHPTCLGGARACPPEDCGGMPGFYNLLQIVNDPKHPEHGEMKEWLGGPFDPEAFDLDRVNALLKRF